MPKSRVIPLIGFFIALLPVLGFPHSWELFFQVVGGLSIVLLSVLISIDKRLTRKAKAERRHMATRVRTEEVTEQPDLNQNSGGETQ